MDKVHGVYNNNWQVWRFVRSHIDTAWTKQITYCYLKDIASSEDTHWRDQPYLLERNLSFGYPKIKANILLLLPTVTSQIAFFLWVQRDPLDSALIDLQPDTFQWSCCSSCWCNCHWNLAQRKAERCLEHTLQDWVCDNPMAGLLIPSLCLIEGWRVPHISVLLTEN